MQTFSSLSFFDPGERDYNCIVNMFPIVVVLQIVVLNLVTNRIKMHKRTNKTFCQLESIIQDTHPQTCNCLCDKQNIWRKNETNKGDTDLELMIDMENCWMTHVSQLEMLSSTPPIPSTLTLQSTIIFNRQGLIQRQTATQYNLFMVKDDDMSRMTNI